MCVPLSGGIRSVDYCARFSSLSKGLITKGRPLGGNAAKRSIAGSGWVSFV